MSDKKVLMHVDADGKSKIEAEGYEGGTCLDATKPFEELFGKTEAPREMIGACGPNPDHGERVR